jgi:Ca2+-binding EF-hand superfamily protein
MNKMKLALVLCGCLISGVAAASPKWDANSDGTVDAQEKTLRHDAMKAKRAEMKAKRIELKAKTLAKFDVNKDGKLDKNERIVMKEQRATAAFKRLDTDGNGSLSFAELKQGKRFAGHHRARRGGLKVR